MSLRGSCIRGPRGLTGILAAVTLAAGAVTVLPTAAQAALPAASPLLTRAPYLTDLTAGSVQVTWATTRQVRGVVSYGPAGNCSAKSATATTLANPITVNGVTEYKNSVTVSGLSPGTAYCYRISTGGSSPVDLLGGNPSPVFTTLDPPDGTSPFTFAVFGDWGDTTNSGSNTGATNVNQAGVLSQVAASGARFAVSVGDLGYPGGSQTNYGDLNQTGVNISAVFGPKYWAIPGMSVPAYVVSGNHGQNATYLNNWPSAAVTAASGGTYAMLQYPSIDGTTPGTFPTSYYAVTVDGVRLYMLDAAWGNSNVGTATGGACGSHCAIYQVDHDAHWTATSAQYQWLRADLAAHPGGLKMAFFHFPLRSDDATEPDDTYLQNTPGSSGSLEQLLADHGVKLVFNGHAHIYQRNVAPPGGVTSYVTGGGGGRALPVGGHGCRTTDAYAVGWSYSKDRGSACGAAPVPADDAQVYHFLKVTVSGSRVSVVPTDSTGATFDPVTYDLSPDSTTPSAPAGLTASRPGTSAVALSWRAATDNLAVGAYDVYRNGAYLTTVPSTALGYTDATITGTGTYTYTVAARDLAGNAATATVRSLGSGAGDTTSRARRPGWRPRRW